MAESVAAGTAAAAAAETTARSFNETGRAVSPLRERLLQLARKYEHMPFREFDVIIPEVGELPSYSNFTDFNDLRVRARSLAEALVAYADYANTLSFARDVEDAYFLLGPDLSTDEDSLKRWTFRFLDENHDYFYFREMRQGKVLMASDLLGANGRSVKRARSE